MIEGEKYHDSLEELFTLQTIEDLISISDPKSSETWPNRNVFKFLDSRGISVRF